ncbi:DUF2937 family protein [uncultured Tateyamaria sp.]|uniref:DUF2937 family protein n=1 Tax=uncultured Tateyamaria sp. TaxID=455651 RepID=UPI00261304AC|nr:DUF2937 family protein [uncultured Tateyamaria sp.]
MIVRALMLAGGLAGGAITSQLPEYSQQYRQRLGGAVDALTEVVTDFDASAQAEGLSRQDALAQMQGTSFIERRKADMTRTFDRYARLQLDLEALEGAGPFMRAYHVMQSADAEVAAAALETFEPAVPLTTAGGIFAGTGFLAGLTAVWGVLKLMLWPIGRRRTARGA